MMGVHDAFCDSSGFDPTTVMSVVSGIFHTRGDKAQEHIAWNRSVFGGTHCSWSASFRVKWKFVLICFVE